MFRHTPVCFALLSILTKDSPCTPTVALNCTEERGGMKFHLIFSLFLTAPMLTCLQVSKHLKFGLIICSEGLIRIIDCNINVLNS